MVVPFCRLQTNVTTPNRLGQVMTNNTVAVIVSSKYLQVNEIHDIKESFNILVVFTIFVGIQLKESGIPLTIGIRNPSSTDKESGIYSLESRIQGCLRLPYRRLKCLMAAFL